jgi:hypothetical protein
MAQLRNAFNSNDVAPQQPFEVLPAGKYRVQIVASEMRRTKDGTGEYLWLEEEILEGEYKDRKIWDRLNLENTNQQAVDIANRTLSAICHAVGVPVITDSEQLHFIPMMATVRVRPAKDGYDASNEIRGYGPVEGGPPRTRSSAARQHTEQRATAAIPRAVADEDEEEENAPPPPPRSAGGRAPWDKNRR